jgi:peptidylprolyl isomerase
LKYLVIGSLAVALGSVLLFNYLQPSTQTNGALKPQVEISAEIKHSSVEVPTNGDTAPINKTEPPKPLMPLQTKDLLIGSGKQVKEGSKVAFNVIIKLQDGRVVFNSYKEGRPWDGIVGNGSILTGLDRGIRGMFQGSKRALWIPPHLAFGPTGIQNQVPPNANLYAEVEMLSIF